MTPTERAEKIDDHYMYRADSPAKQQSIKLVAAEIKAAVEEAESYIQDRYEEEIMPKAVRAAVEDGYKILDKDAFWNAARATAYADCLRIAKDYSGQGQLVYEAIKARAKELDK